MPNALGCVVQDQGLALFGKEGLRSDPPKRRLNPPTTPIIPELAHYPPDDLNALVSAAPPPPCRSGRGRSLTAAPLAWATSTKATGNRTRHPRPAERQPLH